MEREPKEFRIKNINIVLDCAPGQAPALAQFYSKLLNYTLSHPGAGGWAAVTSPAGSVMAFQEVEGYLPPVWPWSSGHQAQMIHLDFVVQDLEAAVHHAVACGARLAPEQYYDDSRTFFDPAGHTFCMDLMHETV